MRQNIKLLLVSVIALGLMSCGSTALTEFKWTRQQLIEEKTIYRGIIPETIYREHPEYFFIDPLHFNNTPAEQDAVVAQVNATTSYNRSGIIIGAYQLREWYSTINKFIKIHNLPSAELAMYPGDELSWQIEPINILTERKVNKTKQLTVLRKNELLSFKLLVLNPSTLVDTDITLHKVASNLFKRGHTRTHPVYTTMLLKYVEEINKEEINKEKSIKQKVISNSAKVAW